MDQLISLSRAYLSYFTREDINVERAYQFIEWVVLVANRSITANSKEIQDKFLVARIWGRDESLIEISAQLNSMLTHEEIDPPLTSIPVDSLIDLSSDPRMKSVQLWQGSDGILIYTSSNDQNYLGMLSSNCRDILPLTNDNVYMPIMGDNYRHTYSEFLKSLNSNEHYRLVYMVRRNVNNPHRFPIPSRSVS